MVSIANQSGPVAKAGTDTGERASVSTPNTIAVMNIGGIGGSITKNMVSPAGVEFESRNEGPGQAPGLIFGRREPDEALARDVVPHVVPMKSTFSNLLITKNNFVCTF